MPTRKATAAWSGGLKGGKGSFKAGSGAIAGAYSFATRFEEAQGTNPEELLAAAFASCYSMALGANLEKAGTPATSIQSDAEITLETVAGAPTITTLKLVVKVKADKLTQANLDKFAEETRTGCPVARALTGVKLEAKATLDQ